VGQAYKQTLGTESVVTNRRVWALEGPRRRHQSRCRPARPARLSGMIWQLAAISQSDAKLEQCKLRAPDAHLGRVSPGDFRTHIFQSKLSRFDSRGRDEDSIVIRHVFTGPISPQSEMRRAVLASTPKYSGTLSRRWPAVEWKEMAWTCANPNDLDTKSPSRTVHLLPPPPCTLQPTRLGTTLTPSKKIVSPSFLLSVPFPQHPKFRSHDDQFHDQQERT